MRQHREWELCRLIAMTLTRTFTARTYHFIGDFGDTTLRVRPDGSCWLFLPGREARVISRSQACAVILALDATQVRGCDFRSR